MLADELYAIRSTSAHNNPFFTHCKLIPTPLYLMSSNNHSDDELYLGNHKAGAQVALEISRDSLGFPGNVVLVCASRSLCCTLISYI